MKNYRRLSDKDIKKLEFYKKSRKTAKKGIKWWGVFTAIFLILIAGVVVFYVAIDNTSSKSLGEEVAAVNSDNNNNENDTAGLDEVRKQELERESEKNKTIENEEENDSKELNEEDSSQSSRESNTEELKSTYDFSQWNKSCARELVVVNRDNPLPAEFNVKTKSCRGREIAIEAADDLEQMIVDAKRDSIVLWLSSGYRNIDLQTRLFNRQVETEKSRKLLSQTEAEERAQRVVAKPGRSEHNTGLAVDFNGVEDNFYTTKAYKWLMDNAHKYGFIERYQKKWKDYTGVIYEPWHFRYVGKEKAPLIRESGKSLEEYVIKKLIK